MEGELTAQEMLKGLWRRRRLVASTFAVVLGVGAAVVAFLPNVWRATSVVRVEPQRPSIELVQPSVTQAVEDRLKTVRQELFARPLLEKIIGELDLYPDYRKTGRIEAAVHELRAGLDVKVEGETAFELSVTGSDPRIVARIANRLPELYAEEAMEVRADQAREAVALFDEELARVSKQVQSREAEIGAFKVAHLGELPEQMEANMRGLERTLVLLTARTESQREMQRHFVELGQSRLGVDTALGRLHRQELDLNHDLLAARSQWTPDHPEVLRLEREIGTVTAKRTAVEAQGRQDDQERAQVRAQMQAIAAEMKQLEGEAQVWRERIDRTPRWGQELSVMSRDYDILRTKYQSILSRKVEAEIARDLEARARSGMFHVLSSAGVPLAPFKPDRRSGLVLALLAALSAGTLAGVFRELQDSSLRRADQAQKVAGPVLAVVPQIRIKGESR